MHRKVKTGKNCFLNKTQMELSFGWYTFVFAFESLEGKQKAKYRLMVSVYVIKLKEMFVPSLLTVCEHLCFVLPD